MALHTRYTRWASGDIACACMCQRQRTHAATRPVLLWSHGVPSYLHNTHDSLLAGVIVYFLSCSCCQVNSMPIFGLSIGALVDMYTVFKGHLTACSPPEHEIMQVSHAVQFDAVTGFADVATACASRRGQNHWRFKYHENATNPCTAPVTRCPTRQMCGES